jgi:hypothetical protein
MHTSRPIAVHGRFLGVAVTQAHGQAHPWRFIATDPAVEDLDGATFRDPAEAERVATLVLHRGRRAAAVRLHAVRP